MNKYKKIRCIFLILIYVLNGRLKSGVGCITAPNRGIILIHHQGNFGTKLLGRLCTHLGMCCTPGGRAGFHFPDPKGRFWLSNPSCSSLPTSGRSLRWCSGAWALLSPFLCPWWCSASLGARPGKHFR